MTDDQNETPDEPKEVKEVHEPKERTFTQAELDQIIQDRLQKERAKFADYDALKSKAGEVATVEERLSAMERRAEDAESRALRAGIASEFGLSAADRDLFLHGSDEEMLRAQAKRLAERAEGQRKAGNVVPAEGNNPAPPPESDGLAFVRQLTGSMQQ